MIKISSTSASKAGTKSLSGNSQFKTTSNTNAVNPATTFTAVLKNSAIKSFDGTMQELIAIVQKTGNIFLRNPNEDNLNSYKDSLKQYLEKFKNEFISLSQEFGLKPNGDKNVYTILNTIESDVAAITRDTLTNNKATELLATLDDIRGLVIDILG